MKREEEVLQHQQQLERQEQEKLESQRESQRAIHLAALLDKPTPISNGSEPWVALGSHAEAVGKSGGEEGSFVFVMCMRCSRHQHDAREEKHF